MDALTFLNEINRLCNSVDTCPNYPLYNLSCDARPDCRPKEDNRDIVTAVEQWAKEHPVKTRQSEFLKMFPNAKINKSGTIDICPEKINSSKDYCSRRICAECFRDYWLQEVE